MEAEASTISVGRIRVDWGRPTADVNADLQGKIDICIVSHF
jgi:hypothetical protein